MTESTIGVDELLRLRRAKPFLPFAFELRSGAQHDVLKGTRFCTNGSGVLLFGPTGSLERFKLNEVVNIRSLNGDEVAEHLQAGHF